MNLDAGPLLVIWGFMAFIGAAIGSAKGKGGEGFILGLLLGPIGWIIVAAMRTPEVSKLDRIQARPANEGWHPDPLGRFDSRYFDGTRWTQHVGRMDTDGTRRQYEDPL